MMPNLSIRVLVGSPFDLDILLDFPEARRPFAYTES